MNCRYGQATVLRRGYAKVTAHSHQLTLQSSVLPCMSAFMVSLGVTQSAHMQFSLGGNDDAMTTARQKNEFHLWTACEQGCYDVHVR